MVAILLQCRSPISWYGLAGLDCGILFSTYDLLISSKSLGKEAKAQLKAAKAAEKFKLQQGKDDGDADKIQFGARCSLG